MVHELEQKVYVQQNNEAYKEKYTEYISQGWELNSVEIEEVNQKAGDTKSRSTTVNTSQGKVILSDFIQPTKTQKHYKTGEVDEDIMYGTSTIRLN